MKLFVGLDLGTSGVRACAIDDQGVVHAEAALPLPPSQRDQAGGSVQHAEHWWQASLQVLKRLCAQLGADAACIARLAVDGTSASLLPCGADGAPLGPARMYDDSRCAPALALAGSALPTNNPAASPSSSLAKLLAFQRQIKAPFGVLHQADWISGRLRGSFGDSDENNCLKLGYDALNRCWPDWLLGLTSLQRLPRVHAAGTPLGPISAQVAHDTGMAADTLVCAGTTDSTAAVLASGIDRPGQAVTVLGSTLVLKVLSQQPLYASDYGIYSHRLGDLWLVGGASNSGGAVLLAQFSLEQIEQMTARLRPERPTGLDYYPLLAPGERFPHNDPHLAPRLEPHQSDPLLRFQGMLEGIAAIERDGYRLLHRLGAPWPSRVFSSGGGSANLAWQHIRQRLLQVPVQRSTHQQAAYGSALLALRQGI